MILRKRNRIDDTEPPAFSLLHVGALWSVKVQWKCFVARATSRGTVLAWGLVVTWTFLLCTATSGPLHPTMGAQADTTPHLEHALEPYLHLPPLWSATLIAWPRATQRCWCAAHRARKITGPCHQKIKYGQDKKCSPGRCVQWEIEAAVVPGTPKFKENIFY